MLHILSYEHFLCSTNLSLVMASLPTRPRVVVVMGPTGVGKTTLINHLAERENLGVSDDIQRGTTELQLVAFTEPDYGQTVHLIDTPGFDDPTQPDIDILEEIANYLAGTYNTGVQLDTILYLHKINEFRMTQSLLKNLKLFVSLCGTQAMPGVVIVTTMWNEVVNKKAAEQREEELKNRVWYDMIANGCSVKRFEMTRDSALNILRHGPRLLEGTLLSSEMVEERKSLQSTAAGHELANDMKNIVEQQKAKIRRLQERAKAAKTGEEKKILEGEIEEGKRKLEKIKEGQARLKPNFLERLFGSKPVANLVPQVELKLKEVPIEARPTSTPAATQDGG
ncbi:hypothetical protein FRC19_009390 [Serendipita sp. 401]|nr:hypothetical protein FRC19_009390 [Serendipita sp. 401]